MSTLDSLDQGLVAIRSIFRRSRRQRDRRHVIRTRCVFLGVDGLQQHPEGFSIECRGVLFVDDHKRERQVRQYRVDYLKKIGIRD